MDSVFKTVCCLLVIITICEVSQAEVCPDGFYGRDCMFQCSDGCRNTRCTTSDFGSDLCTDGCIDGYTGTSCKRRCAHNCKTCQRNSYRNCSQCSNFHYGDACENSCQESCPDTDCDKAGNCLPNKETICGINCEHCDQKQQKCLNCKAGFYGERCRHTCSNTCRCSFGEISTQHDCARRCDMSSGRCSEGCNGALWGPKCQYKCSSNCRDDACLIENGECLKGCKKGFFGEKCELGCNVHCKNDNCNKTGYCETCKDGFYGSDCLIHCPVNCLHDICGREEGECINGCKVGYHGLMCTRKCLQGCVECNRANGECISKIRSSTEKEITIAVAESTDGEINKIQDGGLNYFVFSGVAAFLFLLTIVSIILSCRYRKIRDSHKTEASRYKNTENPNEIYATLNSYCEAYAEKSECALLPRSESFGFPSGRSRKSTISEGTVYPVRTCGLRTPSTEGPNDLDMKTGELTYVPVFLVRKSADATMEESSCGSVQYQSFPDYMKMTIPEKSLESMDGCQTPITTTAD